MSGVATLFAGDAIADPLSVEPRIGITTDYSSNPELRLADVKAESHAAFLFEAPIRYDADNAHVWLIPRARYGDSKGYSSIASNYLQLDANARLNTELSSIGLQVSGSRDSSLYHGGELSNGIGVRRDTDAATVDASRMLTERFSTSLAGSWTRVRYDHSANVSNLVDYRYVSVQPAVTYALSELSSVKLSGSAGRYKTLDGFATSKDVNLQLGVDRALSENWTGSVGAGYSRSTSRYNFFFGPLESTQKGAIYSASVSRKGENLNLTASISRALRPTGFAYLSRQDNLDLYAMYTPSERWDVSATVGLQKTLDPVLGRGDTNRRYFRGQIAVDWRWTPQIVATLRMVRLDQRFGGPSESAASNGVSVEIARQFLRTEF